MTTFSKGDMLILHMTEDYFTHLLVVHVLLEEKVYYCWDTKAEIYRLVYDHPRLHMLCPAFDPVLIGAMSGCLSFTCVSTHSGAIPRLLTRQLGR